MLKSEDMFADPWGVVQRVLAFRGLASPPGYEEQVRGAKHSNEGAKWGGKDYTGRLRCAERLKLARFYRPHNAQLYRMIGRDLGWDREVEASGCGALGDAANAVGGQRA